MLEHIAIFFATKFSPSEVFTSLQAFLGSGYMLSAVVALCVVAALNKIIKLLLVAAGVAIIYFLCASGMLDPVFSSLGLG